MKADQNKHAEARGLQYQVGWWDRLGKRPTKRDLFPMQAPARQKAIATKCFRKSGRSDPTTKSDKRIRQTPSLDQSARYPTSLLQRRQVRKGPKAEAANPPQKEKSANEAFLLASSWTLVHLKRKQTRQRSLLKAPWSYLPTKKVL